MLRDEPNAADFAGLRQRVDAIRAARPGRFGYINLYPDYANAAQLGTPTYDEHVARFVKEVGTDVLSMDHYPMLQPGADGRDGYCRNLEAMRKYSLQEGIPFWNFFNTMPFGPHFDPTEGVDLREILRPDDVLVDRHADLPNCWAGARSCPTTLEL
jgi:hypothetical protein